MKLDTYPSAARNDAAFRRDVEVRVKESFPLLSALANGSVLYLAAELPGTPAAARTERGEMLFRGEHPAPVRRAAGSVPRSASEGRAPVPAVLADYAARQRSRAVLPAARQGQEKPAAEGQAPPPAGNARVVLGEPVPAVEEKAAGGGKEKGQKTNLIQYKRSIQALISHYVPSGKTIDVTLEELAEKWNPLYDTRAKKNLVEDVNASGAGLPPPHPTLLPHPASRHQEDPCAR